MSVRLQLKVAPKSGRNAISGWMGDTLKVSVTAVPERGKANEAVIELLADALRVPKSAIQVVRGASSSQKLVQIEGLTEAEVFARLGKRNVP
jgi:uncharacterized protein (TIGR00251 family)